MVWSSPTAKMKTRRAKRTLVLCLALVSLKQVNAFLSPRPKISVVRPSPNSAASSKIGEEESSDSASRGIVSFLTFAVNSLSRTTDAVPIPIGTAPVDPNDLMDRIARDYTDRNYLWTGDIDYPSFAENCCFSDPTITFNGTDTFARNIGNLRPIVDEWVANGQSQLLSIRLDDDDSYVETRWNMVGQLNKIPWKPRIDVIGRTKFWFNEENKVFFYDEKWEIPAWKALLQLVTSPGTIPNSSEDNKPQ